MPPVRYRRIATHGVDLFYRTAGNADAPTLLLLHGFPSSSFQFRYMLTSLSDRWYCVAPDLPGFGFTRVPLGEKFSYTFDGLAEVVSGWLEALRIQPSAIYLHDYGGHVGFRLLAQRKLAPRALIIQNTEAYYAPGWREPMFGIERRQSESWGEGRAKLKSTLLNEDGIRKEFFEDLPDSMVERIDPAAFQLGWGRIGEPETLEAMLDLHMDYGSNIRCYPEVQSYLRSSGVPTLILWGEKDQYLSREAAEAYRSDSPNADIVLMDGGHWLLESHVEEVNDAVRTFLSRTV